MHTKVADVIGIKQYVARCRMEKGVTKAHLARYIGVSRSYITKLEQGQLQPSAELMLRFAQYFKLPVEDIFKLADAKSAISPAARTDVPSLPPINFPGVPPSMPGEPTDNGGKTKNK